MICFVTTESVSSIKITVENFTHVEKKSLKAFSDSGIRNSTVRKHGSLLFYWRIEIIWHSGTCFSKATGLNFSINVPTENLKLINEKQENRNFFSPGILIVQRTQKFRVQWLISIFKLKFPSSYRFDHHHQALNRQLLDFCEKPKKKAERPKCWIQELFSLIFDNFSRINYWFHFQFFLQKLHPKNKTHKTGFVGEIRFLIVIPEDWESQFPKNGRGFLLRINNRTLLSHWRLEFIYQALHRSVSTWEIEFI